MISPIRGFGLLLFAVALGGCATRSACIPAPYQEARAVAPLAIPEGLNAPDRSTAMRIPEPRGAAVGRIANDPDRCVIEPPIFYVEPGAPNPEGLPVRPSALAAAGVPAAAPGVSRVVREITAFLNEWASAWSQRDADTWLLFYATDYAPSGYAGAEEWRADQRERFLLPATTRIDPNSVSVEPRPDGSAQVRFVQVFGAGAEERRVVKEMILVPRTRGATIWRIVDEQIVEVL